MKKTTETARYEATGSDGRRYVIVETTDFIGSTTLHDNKTTWTPGMKTLRTTTGDHVNKVSDGVYEIMRTRVTLRFAGP